MKISILVSGIVIILFFTSFLNAASVVDACGYRDLTNNYYIITGKMPGEQSLLNSIKTSYRNLSVDIQKYKYASEIGTTLNILFSYPTTNSEIRDALLELYDKSGLKSLVVYAMLNVDRNKGIELGSNIIFNANLPFSKRIQCVNGLCQSGVLLGYPIIEEGLRSSVSSDRYLSEKLVFTISLYENTKTMGGYKVDTAHLLKIARENTNAYIIANSEGHPINRSPSLRMAQKRLWAHHALHTVTNSSASMTNRLYTAELATKKSFYFGYDLIEPGLKSQDPAVKTAAERLLRAYMRLDGAPPMSSVKLPKGRVPDDQLIDSLQLLDIAESSSCLTMSKEELEKLRENVVKRREMRKK